jgi:hypothetical protein
MLLHIGVASIDEMMDSAKTMMIVLEESETKLDTLLS